jgi:cytochrome b561
MPTPVRDLPTRYGAVAMTMHWTIAALIIANLIIGLSMTDPDIPSLIAVHKSIGLLVLVLSVLRLVWRWVNPVPPPPLGLNRWVRIAGRFTHYLFYALMIIIPLAGWLMVSAGARGHPTSFFGLFDWPPFPTLSDMTRSQAHPYHEAFETTHVVLAWAMLFLIPMHIFAALYHHYYRADNVLRRMLPGAKLRSGV